MRLLIDRWERHWAYKSLLPLHPEVLFWYSHLQHRRMFNKVYVVMIFELLVFINFDHFITDQRHGINQEKFPYCYQPCYYYHKISRMICTDL